MHTLQTEKPYITVDPGLNFINPGRRRQSNRMGDSNQTPTMINTSKAHGVNDSIETTGLNLMRYKSLNSDSSHTLKELKDNLKLNLEGVQK